MNSIAALRSQRHIQGRFQPVLGLAAGITLLASIGLAAGGDNRTGDAQLLVAPDASAVTNAAASRSVEQQALVPDEYTGGFRAARNLRERLQAQRRDFSASFD